MRRLHTVIAIMLQIGILVAPAGPLCAETMGISGGRDLDRLWAEAQVHDGFSAADAVLLLESQHVTVTTGGDRTTRVHRVVWIGSSVGIHDYADLRIPYDSANSTLKVTALQTWRDGRWWPAKPTISPTAVVETVPFAMARADDYTSMRETMLLHDGVEIPCVMETAYEITERDAAADGCDGLWVFSQRDPAVLSEFVLTVPSDRSLLYHGGNGAPEPTVTRDEETVTYRWSMNMVAPLGTPLIGDPAAAEPYAVWSTWPGWQTLGRKIAAGFDEAAVLSAALVDTLKTRLAHEPSDAAKARAVAAFVDESTRSIHYDTAHWIFSPRPATRTYETAYGHGVDRAVLATALFRGAGLDAEPIFRAVGPSDIDLDVPGLARFDEPAVWVGGDLFSAYYDPAAGTLSVGLPELSGRILWKSLARELPLSRLDTALSDAGSHFELVLTLEPDEEDGWKGTGFLAADGLFSPYSKLVGLHDEARSHLSRVARSALPGANVDACNLELLVLGRVTAGFELTLAAPEPDDLDRVGLVIGDPSGGLMAQLPADVQLYHEQRSSPVLLADMLTQRVTLRVRTAEREIAQLPVVHDLENDIGRMTVSVEQEDGWVTITRELALKVATVSPEAWQRLRALLLEETDSANRTMLLR